MTYRYCPSCGVKLKGECLEPSQCFRCMMMSYDPDKPRIREEQCCPICTWKLHPVPVPDTPRTALSCSACGYYRDIDCPNSERTFQTPDRLAELREKYNDRPDYCFTEGVISDINELLDMLEAKSDDKASCSQTQYNFLQREIAQLAKHNSELYCEHDRACKKVKKLATANRVLMQEIEKLKREDKELEKRIRRELIESAIGKL